MLGLATTSILVIARSQVYGCLLEQGLGGQCSQCAPSLASLLSTEVRPVLRMVEVRLALGLFCNCMEGGKGGKKEKYHSVAPLPPVHNSWKKHTASYPNCRRTQKDSLEDVCPSSTPTVHVDFHLFCILAYVVPAGCHSGQPPHFLSFLPGTPI